MPIYDNIGQSEYTEMKHRQYRMILSVQMNIVRGAFNKYPQYKNRYLHFDINPGNGGTLEEPGSPLIFRDEVTKHALPHQAYFIEINESNATDLTHELRYDDTAIVIHGDHSEILPEYINNPPVTNSRGGTKWVYGSLFSDENGKQPPWELLRTFAYAYPTIDIIVYVAATNIKRIRKQAEVMGNENVPCLMEQLKTIPKNWIVRQPEGAHHWTFLIGSYEHFPEFKKHGFVSVKSAEGQKVLHKLTYTKNELSGQLELPFYVPPTDPIANI